MKHKVKCPHCNHEWETKSKLVLVTCAGCGLKIRNPVKDFKKQPKTIENEPN